MVTLATPNKSVEQFDSHSLILKDNLQVSKRASYICVEILNKVAIFSPKERCGYHDYCAVQYFVALTTVFLWTERYANLSQANMMEENMLG